MIFTENFIYRHNHKTLGEFATVLLLYLKK
jgi:hypothetical protein